MSEQVVPTRRKVDPEEEIAEVIPGKGLFGALETFFAFVGETSILAGQVALEIARGGVKFSDLVAQMAAVGADSIWIVLIVTTATGAVFAYYVTNLSLQLGYTAFVGGALGYGFLNELGAVLGGVALAARAGAAIAAEIGTMVVTEQVDALRAMGVSPIRFLVAPRVLAAVIMLPLLTAIADVAGVFGGYYFAHLRGITKMVFWSSIHQFVGSADLIHGLIKAVVFGFLIGTVACQEGLNTKGGATGVGRSTTRSVVLCVILIFVSDVFLTQMLSGPDFAGQ
jgi:phospholipid/cholesterol/gamma-HCH transport system permease protein